MNKTVKPVAIVAVFMAITGFFSLIVMNQMRNPVNGTTVRYTAKFTDVAGLFVGNDVRIAGVPVGKVEVLRLDGHDADVEFSLLKTQPLYMDTIVAVRYQNLLGQRYVELVQPKTPSAPMAQGSTVPIERTIPSFDISKLFNGFRPLFQTLDPAQFNQFGEDLLRVIQGDGTGSGIGPVLHDLDAISKIAVNREAVFVRLMRNLGEVSSELGGKSKQVVALIDSLNSILAQVLPNLDQLSGIADEGRQLVKQLLPLVRYLERTIDTMSIPYYDFLMRVLPHTPAILGSLLNLAPSLLQGIREESLGRPPIAPSFTCSNGVAELPGVGEVPFGDQNLVLCR